MHLNLRNTDVDYPNPRRLTAEWGKESMEIELKYVGPSSGYLGAQLDGEVIPRIVACVNACAEMDEPAATIALIRERAINALASLGAFVMRYSADLSLVTECEEVTNATVELSTLLTLLPHEPQPVTLSPEDAASLRDLIDSLATLAGGDDGLDSDQAAMLSKGMQLLQP